MPKGSSPPPPTPSYEPGSDLAPGPRELVAVTRRDAGLRARDATAPGARDPDTAALAAALDELGARLVPLFGESEEQVLDARARTASTAGLDVARVPDLSIFYRVDAPDARLEAVAERLRANPLLESVYLKPPVFPAVAPGVATPPTGIDAIPGAGVRAMPPASGIAPPAVTPDFSGRQGYLLAAPGGVDAVYAWGIPGGRGANVRVVDVEGAWRFAHEDLLANAGGLAGGTMSADPGWLEHGTAVLGEIGGDANGIGVTGIAPDAFQRGVSIFGGPGAAGAIRMAADLLAPGDLLLIELHQPGPRFNFAGRGDQRGYVAMEWWPDVYEAIRYAVARGVVVVEAGGNGAENLDDAIYDANPAPPFGPFPAWWRNPYRRNPLDSGAIVVGAGAPPPGTHGRNHGADRSRLDFSNFGALIDAQGWGREVTTTGYGDLQGGFGANRFYTDTFSGTSSASPIVVGALASVQGALRAAGRIPLTPARARELLRSTGSPQQPEVGRPVSQRIGNRPNLRQMLTSVLAPASHWGGTQFTGVVPGNGTVRWFTFNWPAHWHVVWTVVPTTAGGHVKYAVQVQRASDAFITYWISVTNLGPTATSIEGRFDVLGW